MDIVKNYLSKIFSIDVRALAVFRIAAASILLIDFANRARVLLAHYTDAGIYPRQIAMQFYENPWVFSLHFISGSWHIQTLLFSIAALAAFALLLGYRTRLALFVSWLLLISLHTRNPMILQGGDVLLRLTLFWSLFLPLGARFSFDARKAKVKNQPRAIASLGSAAYLIQFSILYFFSALLKTGKQWIPDGTAVYYALQADVFHKPLGSLLLQYPDLMKFLTFATFALEALIPFVLLSPFFTNAARIIGAFSIIGLHAGFLLFLEIGPFPWVGILSMLPFLPPPFWDWIEKRFTHTPSSDPIPLSSSRSSIHARIAGVCALFLLGFVFVWNMHNTRPALFHVPKMIENTVYFLRLDQYWNMFAPYPLVDDGWYVIAGTLTNRKQIDLWRNGAPLSFEKPTTNIFLLHGDRWRRYMMNLWWREYGYLRPYYLRFVCEEWNAKHPEAENEKLESVEMIYMLERTRANYEKVIPKRKLLSLYQCP